MVEGKVGLLIPPCDLCKDNEPVRILESVVRKEGEGGGRPAGLGLNEHVIRLDSLNVADNEG